jgi:hypothetical protein
MPELQPGGKLKLSLLLSVGAGEFYYWHRLPAKVRAEGQGRLVRTLSKFLVEVGAEGQSGLEKNEGMDAPAKTS